MNWPPRSCPPGLPIERRSLTEPMPQIGFPVSRRGSTYGHTRYGPSSIRSPSMCGRAIRFRLPFSELVSIEGGAAVSRRTVTAGASLSSL